MVAMRRNHVGEIAEAIEQQFNEAEAWKYTCDACEGLGIRYITSWRTNMTSTSECGRCSGGGIDPQARREYEAAKTEAIGAE
jgi:DnaJ-class molecular chaperone